MSRLVRRYVSHSGTVASSAFGECTKSAAALPDFKDPIRGAALPKWSSQSFARQRTAEAMNATSALSGGVFALSVGLILGAESGAERSVRALQRTGSRRLTCQTRCQTTIRELGAQSQIFEIASPKKRNSKPKSERQMGALLLVLGG